MNAPGIQYTVAHPHCKPRAWFVLEHDARNYARTLSGDPAFESVVVIRNVDEFGNIVGSMEYRRRKIVMREGSMA